MSTFTDKNLYLNLTCTFLDALENFIGFLQSNSPELLAGLLLVIRRNMWFIYDGVSSYFSIAMREHLIVKFENKRRGRGRLVVWPPRSLELNSLDFL